jgi:hypothetical protein
MKKIPKLLLPMLERGVIAGIMEWVAIDGVAATVPTTTIWFKSIHIRAWIFNTEYLNRIFIISTSNHIVIG